MSLGQAIQPLLFIFAPVIAAFLIELPSARLLARTSSQTNSKYHKRRRIEDVVPGHRMVLGSMLILIAAAAPEGSLFSLWLNSENKASASVHLGVILFVSSGLLGVYIWMLEQICQIKPDCDDQRRRSFERCASNVFRSIWLNILGLTASVATLSYLTSIIMGLQQAKP